MVDIRGCGDGAARAVWRGQTVHSGVNVQIHCTIACIILGLCIGGRVVLCRGTSHSGYESRRFFGVTMKNWSLLSGSDGSSNKL